MRKVAVGVVRDRVPKILIASCGRYIFRNFMYANAIIMSEYVVHQWLFINIETNDFESKSTLKSHIGAANNRFVQFNAQFTYLTVRGKTGCATPTWFLPRNFASDAMHFSAKRGLGIAMHGVCLSVRMPVCNVGGL